MIRESKDSSRQADATAEVEVTPEMIEAGLQIYWRHLPVEAGKEPHDRQKVVDIFRVMFRARRK
jgi:hypothetical protein